MTNHKNRNKIEQLILIGYFFLAFENIVDPDFNIRPTKHMVMDDGVVVSERLILMPKLSCSFDVARFPFDEQNCFINIAIQLDSRARTFYGYQIKRK